jgi:hypothetical protein
MVMGRVLRFLEKIAAGHASSVLRKWIPLVAPIL